MKIKLVAFLFLLLPVLAVARGDEENVRLIIHVLDYLKKDYRGAVENGKVVNQYEYSEQVDFANTVVTTSKELRAAKLAEKAEELRKAIVSKRDDVLVRDLVDKVRNELDKNFRVIQAPSAWPSLEEGKKLFSANCVTCHGLTGAGDGAAGAGLNPPPTNFLDKQIMESSSPTRVFNTLKLGISNTPMRAFTELNDEQLWALSFFVTSLRHPFVAPQDTADLSLLEEVALRTDQELIEKYPQINLAAVRHISFDKTATGYIQMARFFLTRSQSAFAAGDFATANTEAVKAYLEGVEPLEPRLRASDFSIVAKVEERMAGLREAIKKQEDKAAFTQHYQTVQESLKEIESLLTNSHLSPAVVFGTSAAIFLREGFEAVLIILALLSVLRAIGGMRAIVWVHAGWIAAMLLGVVFWFFSGSLLNISGAQRETLEAVISLFAVIILLYMGFWLHSRTEVDRWKTFLGTEMKRIVEDKKFVGLFTLSFIGVFRESFETVLFLRAIAIETAPGEQYLVLWGVLTALVLILFLAWMLMRFTRLVPIRTLFVFCAVTVAVLAVILMGKGIHSLQEIGWMSVTSTPFNLRAEILGIFPTWECWIAQIVTVATAVLLWNVGSRPAFARAQNS